MPEVKFNPNARLEKLNPDLEGVHACVAPGALRRGSQGNPEAPPTPAVVSRVRAAAEAISGLETSSRRVVVLETRPTDGGDSDPTLPEFRREQQRGRSLPQIFAELNVLAAARRAAQSHERRREEAAEVEKDQARDDQRRHERREQARFDDRLRSDHLEKSLS